MERTDTGATVFQLNAGTGTSEYGQAPIRIAQVVGKVVLSGVDQVVMNYYRHIDRTKVQFDFYMDGIGDTPLDDEIRELGGRVFKLPSYEGGMRQNLAAFRKHLRTNEYSIVHSHMNTLSGFWLREAKKAGVPVRIAHSHSTAAHGERKRALLKYALRPFARMYANEYLACTEHAGRWQFGSRRFASGEVRLIKNAIATEAFARCEETRTAVRSDLEVDNELVIGHVGRFEYQKNHQFLVEVFDEVRRLRPDASLLLVGHGELRQDIEEICRRKGIADKVIFTGARSDVPRLMQAMDCFVFPSHFEGLGMAVIEAQTAGLPCVVSSEVPSEASVTSQCRSLNLSDSATQWAAEITRSTSNQARCSSPEEEIRRAGYRIQDEAPKLTALYLQLARTANTSGTHLLLSEYTS